MSQWVLHASLWSCMFHVVAVCWMNTLETTIYILFLFSLFCLQQGSPSLIQVYLKRMLSGAESICEVLDYFKHADDPNPIGMSNSCLNSTNSVSSVIINTIRTRTCVWVSVKYPVVILIITLVIFFLTAAKQFEWSNPSKLQVTCIWSGPVLPWSSAENFFSQDCECFARRELKYPDFSC